MTYIIYKDGIEENRIVADEDFCKQYYSGDGYSYEAELPTPVEPTPPEPDEISRLKAQVAMLEAQQTFLEDCLLEMADEVYA